MAKEDIREMAHATLRHRVMLNFEGQADGITIDAIVDDLIANVHSEAAVA